MRHTAENLLALLTLAFLSGCSTVGVHHAPARNSMDFGPREEIRICLYAEDGISEDEALRVMAPVQDEFTAYGVDVSIPWVRPWTRDGFFSGGIFAAVAMQQLEAPCDRLLTLGPVHI